jgi:hypothetical protein
LVGQWIRTPSGEPVEFNADGTFERQIPLLGGQGVVGSQPVLGQWRWLDNDWIEIDSFGQRGDRARVVIDGDVLKLLRPNGDVDQYRRR